MSSELPTQQTTQKFRLIADQIARAIQLGHYSNGDKLPPQRQLAAQLGVSTGTVTLAYSELVRRRLVSARVGDGTYVNCVESRSLAPTTINMGYNVPAPSPLALASLQSVLINIGNDSTNCRQLLNYPPEFGADSHREAFAQWLRRMGTSGHTDRVMLSNGAQHAIACVLRTFSRPGDVLLTEALSYHGLLALTRELRLQVVAVPSDAQGMLPDGLATAASRHKAKLFFCIPSLQMPTGCTMSLERRLDLAFVAEKNQLLLIEDCVQALGQKSPLPALSTFLPDRSFLIGSFSKICAPALRVGFIEAAPKWLGNIARVLRADSVSVPSLLPEVVTRWIHDGHLAQLIQEQRHLIDVRLSLARQQMEAFTQKDDSVMSYVCTQEFPFLWLRLASTLRAKDVVERLQSQGVFLRSAEHFCMGKTRAPQGLRISLSAPNTESEMEQGLSLVLTYLKAQSI